MSEKIFSKLWSPGEQADAETSGLNLPRMTTMPGTHWSPQHPARVWEYYNAVAAFDENPDVSEALVLDVGGAGSPLPWIFARVFETPVQIIDPAFNGLGMGNDVAFCHYPHQLRGKADFIACISVLEHVKDEAGFLKDIVNLLAPGGVLFLTVDYDPTNAEKDEFQFHWMRERIYNHERLYGLYSPGVPTPPQFSVSYQLKALGMRDWPSEHFMIQCRMPDHLRDIRGAEDPPTIPGLGYTFASLCMRKEA